MNTCIAGDTALHNACYYASAGIVQILVNTTDLTVKNTDGNSQLYSCCVECPDYYDIDCGKKCEILESFAEN